MDAVGRSTTRLHDVCRRSSASTRGADAHLSAQLRFARDDWKNLPRADDSDTGLRRPNDPTNPTGKWAVGYRAATQEQRQEQKAYRATVTANFRLTRFTENQLILGGEPPPVSIAPWWNTKVRFRPDILS